MEITEEKMDEIIEDCYNKWITLKNNLEIAYKSDEYYDYDYFYTEISSICSFCSFKFQLTDEFLINHKNVCEGYYIPEEPNKLSCVFCPIYHFLGEEKCYNVVNLPEKHEIHSLKDNWILYTFIMGKIDLVLNYLEQFEQEKNKWFQVVKWLAL